MTNEASRLAEECKRLARKFAGHSALPIATAVLQGKYDAVNEQVGIPITQELIDLDAALDRLAALSQERGDEASWQPMDTAPKVVGRIIGAVEGRARFICWGKTSHVPLYGWILTDQGPEDADLCEPTAWMPLPDAALAASTPQGQEKPR